MRRARSKKEIEASPPRGLALDTKHVLDLDEIIESLVSLKNTSSQTSQNDPYNDPRTFADLTTPNPTTLALIPFEGPTYVPSPRNEIGNDDDVKGKELAVAITSLS